jgi:hypothetical protein
MYVCMYVCLCMYVLCMCVCICVCMHACFNMEREMQGYTDIKYHVLPHISIRGNRSANRSQDGPSYLTAARGPDLSALRACPAPNGAAADRCHQGALRDCLARLSLQRSADERAAKCVGVLTVVLYVLATGMVSTHTCSIQRCARIIHRIDRQRRLRWCRCACSGGLMSTHGGTLRTQQGAVSTHTCSIQRCAHVIHRLDRRRRCRCRRTCSLRRRGRVAGMCAREAVHPHPGCSRVSPVRP